MIEAASVCSTIAVVIPFCMQCYRKLSPRAILYNVWPCIRHYGVALQLVLELQPEVTALRNGETYKLIGKGFDEPLICRKSK
jgi:hypothetical protein